MQTIHGGGGVESRHAASAIAGLASEGERGMACDVIVAASKRQSRSSDRPASTLSDGEEYARDACADGSPDVIKNYADRRGV